MLGSIYAMVGVAFTLGMGVLKFLNFSIPGLFMVAAMTTWALVRIGAPWPLAALGALAAGVALALVVERFTWRWMRQSDPLLPLVSSMAFLMLFENLAVAYWGSDLRSLPRLFDNADWRIGTLVVNLPQLAGLAISVVLIACLSALLNNTASRSP
jgi:branched-chain amino acid transport system permease protein